MKPVAALLWLAMTSPPSLAADTGVEEPTDATVESAPAQAEPAAEPVFPLPRVAVQGRGERADAPASLIVREVTAEDIRARNAFTVGDALVHVPGVNVQIGGSSGDARAWIRGYRDRDVLVLFDGIPIASGFEGTIDLNEIATQRVERIRVIKSAPSVIYGTNGVGGVIDIQPRLGASGKEFEAQGELGTDERRLGRAAWTVGDEHQAFNLSAQYQRADDYSLSDDYPGALNQPPGDRVNSDFERASVFASYELQDWALGHTRLFLNLADAEKGLPVETGVEDPDFEWLTASERRTVGLSHGFVPLPLTLKLYYNAYDSELSVFTDETFSMIDEVERNEDYAVGARAFYTWDLSERHTLVFAAGWQKDYFEGEGELEDGNQAELATWTLAVEDEFAISETLSLAVGGIFTYFDQTLLDQSSSEFNPQAALAWRISEAWTVHASAAQRTRFPKLRELYRRRFGNPDLDPQEAENYELGVRYEHRPGWTSDAALFRSDIDGLIERENRRGTYVNFEPVTIEGIELYSGGWLTDRSYARLGYTCVDAEEDLPEGGSRPLRSRPQHTIIGEYRQRFEKDIELAFRAIYVADLFDLDPDQRLVRLPSFLVMDLKASWQLDPRWLVYANLSNLADEDYEHRLGYPREGRAFAVGANFSW